MQENRIIFENTVFLDVVAEDANELLALVYQQLLKDDYVEPGFLEALLQREKQYPTGLQGKYQAIAIPHADPIYVKRSFIAAVRSAQPLQFKEMSGQGKCLEVQIIFILGLKDGQKQLNSLGALIELFVRSSESALAFMQAETIEECLEIFAPLQDKVVKE